MWLKGQWVVDEVAGGFELDILAVSANGRWYYQYRLTMNGEMED